MESIGDVLESMRAILESMRTILVSILAFVYIFLDAAIQRLS